MKRKILLATLITALLLSASGCGDTADSTEETLSTDTTSSVETEPDYVYPELDLGGGDFTILNTSTTWGFYTDIDFEEATGDKLDDAIYDRNTFLEDKFNFNLVAIDEDIDKIVSVMNASIMAGDDQYQVGIMPTNRIAAMITDQSFCNLAAIPELQLNEPWWDKNINDESCFHNDSALYFAASDLSLMGIDGMMGIFINKNMMNNLGQEMPYQQVRDGKWTLDAMYSLMKLGASLNGDESFTWSADGAATYGHIGWDSGVTALLIGAGAKYIKSDENNLPVIAFEDEQFYNAAEKIASIISQPGEYLDLNKNQNPDHYEMAFRAGRTLMTTAQIKATSKFRDMEDDYGIVPTPKYDESQSDYYVYTTPLAAVCIPVTNQDISTTASLIDAMAYLTWRDVLPEYYDNSLSQKQLRDEDSIEMLALMRDSRHFEIGQCYGWTNTLTTNIAKQIMAGGASIASTIASGKEAVITSIEETLELLW